MLLIQCSECAYYYDTMLLGTFRWCCWVCFRQTLNAKVEALSCHIYTYITVASNIRQIDPAMHTLTVIRAASAVAVNWNRWRFCLCLAINILVASCVALGGIPGCNYLPLAGFVPQSEPIYTCTCLLPSPGLQTKEMARLLVFVLILLATVSTAVMQRSKPLALDRYESRIDFRGVPSSAGNVAQRSRVQPRQTNQTTNSLLTCTLTFSLATSTAPDSSAIRTCKAGISNSSIEVSYRSVAVDGRWTSLKIFNISGT